MMPSRFPCLLVGSSVAAVALVLLSRLRSEPSPRTIRSPRTTLLPSLSKAEQEALAYPPDVFPGARDVSSAYGTIRVYEWGPEEGRKVLLIHGISTPCISLGGIANQLVDRGCRVMLLDLWGRGYSDGIDLPLDSRLYTTELLLALASSPLSWTGAGNGFTLIGYSLGGGISADFATYFPDLVTSLVLLAPAGLIRPSHFGWQSKLMYSGWIPASLLERIVRRRLQAPAVPSTAQKSTQVENAVNEEVRGARDVDFESAPLSKARPGATVGAAVQWQLESHEGFVRAFISSLQHASITGKQEVWRMLGLRSDRVMIIAGSTDSVIVPAELEVDATAAVGSEHVDFKVIEGGHEFPITRALEVVDEIERHWTI
ncbi:alpha beta hydrolase family [Phlyctema vagabunda]|uniref:Alpha beta hydrolase family n=1 Tax=Phlyctema vagabunda TaxID=108571 RepID=A0ABR4P7P6_9HELO